MAKAKKLPSGNWRARVYVGKDDLGKNIYKSFTAETKGEAEYQASSYLVNYKDQIKRKPTEYTVKEAIDRYIDLCDTLSPTTVRSYKAMQAYAFTSLMNKCVKDISDVDAQLAINKEAKRKNQTSGKVLSPKTVKNEWGLISAALSSVCGVSFKVRLPKVQKDVEELPDPRIIIKTIKDTEIELPCLLAMWMGLRMSEVRGLTYKAASGKYAYINQVAVKVDGVEIVKKTAKTSASKRKVLIPNYIKNLINTRREETGASDDDLIVPMSANAIYLRFKKMMLKQGIAMSFHDLRHVYASISLNTLGLPPKVVQISGGWASSYVMDNIYSQTFSDLQIESNKKLDAYFKSIID